MTAASTAPHGDAVGRRCRLARGRGRGPTAGGSAAGRRTCARPGSPASGRCETPCDGACWSSCGRHRGVGERGGRVQTDAARLRPDGRGDPRRHHPHQGARAGRQHPDGQLPGQAPAHLEVAGSAHVVGGVEHDALAVAGEVGDRSQGEGAEDAEPLVVGQGGGVDGPQPGDRASGGVQEPPAQERAVADHPVIMQRHPGRRDAERVLAVLPVQEGLVVRVVGFAQAARSSPMTCGSSDGSARRTTRSSACTGLTSPPEGLC